MNDFLKLEISRLKITGGGKGGGGNDTLGGI
jgi:hypothetical protein